MTMANFKSDAQGFLVGELLDGNRDLLASQRSGVRVWREIRSDVKAIARAVGAQVATGRRASQPGGVSRGSVDGRAGAGAGVGSQRATSPSGRSGPGGAAGQPRRALAARTSGASSRSVVAVASTSRDTKGRFVAGQSRGGAGDESTHSTSMGVGLARISDKIGSLSVALSPVDNVDPTLNAAKEISDAVSPLGRGMLSMFGRGAERKKERWYQRIWAALKAKPEVKVTGGVGSPGGGLTIGIGGGGLMGGLMGGLLGKGGGLLGGLLGRGGKLLQGGSGLLRRLPMLGALLSGGLALGSAFGMNDDPTKSAAENRAMRFRGTGEALGMGAGGIAGALLGSLLGPVGTVAGGYLGSLLGEKVGGALGDLTRSFVDSDLPGKMLAAWNSTMAGMASAWASFTAGTRSAWTTTTKVAGSAWDGTKRMAGAAGNVVSTGANTANKAIRDFTGVDVKAAAKSALSATKAFAGAAGAKAVEVVQSAGAAMVPSTLQRAGGAVSRLVESVGKTRVYERSDGITEERKGGTVSWRNNNPGNLKFEYAGSADKTVESKRTKKRALADAQERFRGVVDLDQWGNAIFATEEHGRAAKATLLKGKHGGKTIEEMLPGYAKNDYSGDANHAAYAAGIHKTAAERGVDLRGKKIAGLNPAEMNALLDGMKRVEGFKVGTVTTAGLPKAPAPGLAVASLPPVASATVPSAVPGKIPPAPEVQAPPTQVNSSTRTRERITVSLPEATGQNIGDRGLAHIVSGGIGGG